MDIESLQAKYFSEDDNNSSKIKESKEQSNISNPSDINEDTKDENISNTTSNDNINDDIYTDSDSSEDMSVRRCAVVSPKSTEEYDIDTDTSYTDDDIYEQRKLDKKDVNSTSWYHNWVNDDNEEDSDKDKKVIKRSSGIKSIIHQYCSDWEDSPSDIAVFFLCLSTLLKPRLDKKDKVFNKELILNAYHYGEYAFAAYKVGKKNVIESLGFLDSDNFITGNWNKKELKEAPAWYVAIDKDEKAVILALRGTKERDDIFVDLAASFKKWEDGYVHQGFLNSFKTLEPMILPVIEKQMSLHKDYKLRIVGHSMGAAVASLVTLKWYKEYPDWNIHGYGYATPCVLSHHLTKRSKECFTTFVHHFDAVARISMGSIEDLHHAMRLFIQKIKETFNHSLKILRTLNFALCARNDKIKHIIDDIDKEITSKLDSIAQSDKVTHLFPAGITYQLWREKRGANFKAWQLYNSSWLDYGRIFFSSSMLKDHGSGNYRAGFENMLSISIAERKIWKNLPASRKLLVHNYWHSYPEGEVNEKDFDLSYPINNMKKDSKYKMKAFVKGLIRPFLFLVSMSPIRRAAIASLLGLNLTKKTWYTSFDPHHEAYYIIKTSGNGLQFRGNTTGRNIIPIRHDSNWYMILHNCGEKVKSGQKKYLSKDITNLLSGTDKGFRETINDCRTRNSALVNEMEEILMLFFFSLTDVDAGKQDFEPIEPPKDLKDSKEYSELVKELKDKGFSQESFISRLAIQTLQESSVKRANEVYSWGAVLRDKDKKRRKHAIEVIGILGLAGFVCITTFPFLVVAPPLAILPIGAAIALGGVALSKPMRGALVAIIAGCLQQRIALAERDIYIDDYYPKN